MLLMGPSASSGLAARWPPSPGSSVSACQVCIHCTQFIQKHRQKESLSHNVVQAELGTLFLIPGSIYDVYTPLGPYQYKSGHLNQLNSSFLEPLFSVIKFLVNSLDTKHCFCSNFILISGIANSIIKAEVSEFGPILVPLNPCIPDIDLRGKLGFSFFAVTIGLCPDWHIQPYVSCQSVCPAVLTAFFSERC